MLCGVWVNTIC